MADFEVTVTRPGTAERFTQTFSALASIGRNPDSDIHLPDPEVSRSHAELVAGEGADIIVRDLGSTNGCVVQGSKLVNGEVVVPGQAMIQVGPYVLAVTSSAASDATVIAPLPDAAATPEPAPVPVPGGTQTIMFSDIDNSTPLTAQLGDRRWMDVLHEHNDLVRSCITAHGGYEVKTVGDEFMVSFQSAIDAVQCAVSIQQALGERNETAETEILAQIGLHTGEPVVEDGDLFGSHINFAARIAGQADGGEIIVSALLRQLIEPSGEFHFTERGSIELRGVPGMHELHFVDWQSTRVEGAT